MSQMCNGSFCKVIHKCQAFYEFMQFTTIPEPYYHDKLGTYEPLFASEKLNAFESSNFPNKENQAHSVEAVDHILSYWKSHRVGEIIYSLGFNLS